MKILFFSTNSNIFDENTYFIKNFPKNEDRILQLNEKYPDFQFFAVTQKPGMFVSDSLPSKNIFFISSDSSAEIADFIASFHPDLAVAASFWTTPFDWLPVKDALVSEELKKEGIPVICNPLNTASLCFDKYETYNFLKQNGFTTPQTLCIHHDLFFCGGNRVEIKSNVYKEAVLSSIKKLKLPLIIKSTTGLSSYAMQVLNTYGEVKNYLNSKKNNSDRVIQEYIDGLQMGCEIYGKEGFYFITAPFLFSTNQYGITSPKQSIKTGPLEERLNIKGQTITEKNLLELHDILQALAEKMELNGIAQVDLIFKDEKWYILEINPRLSGMTTCTEAAYNVNCLELLSGLKKTEEIKESKYKILNIKTKLLEKPVIDKLMTYSFIKRITQTEDKKAKQEREKGYCELIISADSYSKLIENLTLLYKENINIMEEEFVHKAIQMLSAINFQ